jgi:hypothetical protein
MLDQKRKLAELAKADKSAVASKSSQVRIFCGCITINVQSVHAQNLDRLIALLMSLVGC